MQVAPADEQSAVRSTDEASVNVRTALVPLQ